MIKIYDDWNPVYDEPEWPNKAACSGDMINRNGVLTIYDEPESPNEGGVFNFCDEPESPNEGGGGGGGVV